MEKFFVYFCLKVFCTCVFKNMYFFVNRNMDMCMCMHTRAHIQACFFSDQVFILTKCYFARFWIVKGVY